MRFATRIPEARAETRFPPHEGQTYTFRCKATVHHARATARTGQCGPVLTIARALRAVCLYLWRTGSHVSIRLEEHKLCHLATFGQLFGMFDSVIDDLLSLADTATWSWTLRNGSCLPPGPSAPTEC
jgi:hypothetical protein